MVRLEQPRNAKRRAGARTTSKFRPRVAVAVLAMFSLMPTSAAQQGPANDHAAHHPKKKGSTTSPGDDAMGGPATAGKRGGMGEMMRKMGVPPPKELYPSLMALPDLPLEKRGELQARAHERMKAGAARLSAGLERLGAATPGDDFAAMQTAVETMRLGLAEFQSGLATHRALAEGKPPRSIALQWFKTRMNLLQSLPNPRDAGPLGLTWFHFLSMGALVTFTVAMLWMYFHKMRRATELLTALANAPETSESRSDATAPTKGNPRVTEAKWSGKLRICQVFAETPDIRTFRMVGEDGSAPPFRFLPGQFLTLTAPHDGGQVKRSYTIASSPTVRGYVEITVKREVHGTVSRYLHDRVAVGDTLEVSAPAGKFTFTGTEASSIVLIGAGVGITPLMSVIRYLTDVGWPGRIILIFACRTTADFVFREELDHLERRHDRLEITATMTRGEGTSWTGPTGRLDQDLIANAAPGIQEHRVHVCGPTGMMEATKQILADLRVPPANIKTEAFGRPKAPRGTPIKDGPTAAETTALVSVSFASSHKTAPMAPDQTILDVADAAGVDIENSCRAGTCGSCVVKLLQGQVDMEVEDGLAPDQKAEGWVLACQAKAEADVTIDA